MHAFGTMYSTPLLTGVRLVAPWWGVEQRGADGAGEGGMPVVDVGVLRKKDPAMMQASG